MDRITRKDLARALGWLCQAAGKEVGTGEGQWSLDYYQYGGWLVQEGMGGRPFGNRRRTAREMYDTLCFAQQAFFLVEKGKGE